jgi:hypothetical protein
MAKQPPIIPRGASSRGQLKDSLSSSNLTRALSSPPPKSGAPPATTGSAASGGGAGGSPGKSSNSK